MWGWLSDMQHIIELLTGILALAFGASAKTIRVLKGKDTTIKVSWSEWVYNQATALPLGLIVLLLMPEYKVDVSPPSMLGVMIGVGVFSTEVWSFMRSKIPHDKE